MSLILKSVTVASSFWLRGTRLSKQELLSQACRGGLLHSEPWLGHDRERNNRQELHLQIGSTSPALLQIKRFPDGQEFLVDVTAPSREPSQVLGCLVIKFYYVKCVSPVQKE